MAAKMDARRRAAYLAALAATGNRTLAAERAKVSRSWVLKLRTTDPTFAADFDAAVATAKARLDGASGVGPVGAWRARNGEELTVQSGNGRWRQVTRTRLRQWTPRIEARFLAEVGASCNVQRACAAVEMSRQSAYAHRRRWPDFAERWDAAIEQGYDRLAAALVANVGAMLGDTELVPEVDMGPVTVTEAVQLLGRHKRRAMRDRRVDGRTARVRTLAEVTPSILDKIEMVRRASRAEREGAAEAERGSDGA